MLDVTAALFRGESPLFRRPGRLGRAPWRVDVECLAKALDEALLGDPAVAGLAALVVDDDSDLRPEAVDHPLALHRTEGGRRLEIEPQLDTRVGPIGVLSARSARRRERHLQLVARDPHRARDWKDVEHRARLP